MFGPLPLIQGTGWSPLVRGEHRILIAGSWIPVVISIKVPNKDADRRGPIWNVKIQLQYVNASFARYWTILIFTIIIWSSQIAAACHCKTCNLKQKLIQQYQCFASCSFDWVGCKSSLCRPKFCKLVDNTFEFSSQCKASLCLWKFCAIICGENNKFNCLPFYNPQWRSFCAPSSRPHPGHSAESKICVNFAMLVKLPLGGTEYPIPVTALFTNKQGIVIKYWQTHFSNSLILFYWEKSVNI